MDITLKKKWLIKHYVTRVLPQVRYKKYERINDINFSKFNLQELKEYTEYLVFVEDVLTSPVKIYLADNYKNIVSSAEDILQQRFMKLETDEAIIELHVITENNIETYKYRCTKTLLNIPIKVKGQVYKYKTNAKRIK
jgi:hypothetical protein